MKTKNSSFYHKEDTVVGVQVHLTIETKLSLETRFSADKNFYQYDEQRLVL